MILIHYVDGNNHLSDCDPEGLIAMGFSPKRTSEGFGWPKILPQCTKGRWLWAETWQEHTTAVIHYWSPT
jgi:hypothetical protein